MAIITKTASKEIAVVEKIICDNCQGHIPFVFEESSMHEGVQGTGMLHVTLEGGYGEYVDGNSSVHLCKACADALRLAFPLFDKVLTNTAFGWCDWRDQDHGEKVSN